MASVPVLQQLLDPTKGNAAPILPRGGLTPLPAMPPPADMSQVQGAPAPAMPPPLRPLVENGSFRGQEENYYNNDIAKQQAWLAPKPEEPGFWHKLGHIANTIRNVAESSVAPNWAVNDPTNPMYHQRELASDLRNQAGLQGQDTSEQQNAEANAQKEQGLEIEQQRVNQEGQPKPGEVKPVDLAQAYANAVQSAITAGRDPSSDPVVGHLADAITSIQKQPAAAKPEGMHAVTLQTPGGGRVAGKTDAQGNLLLENGQPAPAGSTLYQQPNYGQLILPTKTATYISPATGLPEEFQLDMKNMKYDQPIGMSATNAYGHEAAQAGAVVRAGDELINTLQTNKDKLGTLGAWVQKHGLNTPIADPTLQGIQTQLSSFAALNPAMHGARGTEAMKHFEDLIGGLQQNPDATIAGIRSIMKTAGAINPGLNVGGSPPQGGPAVGTVEGGYRFKGGDPSKQENWVKQ